MTEEKIMLWPDLKTPQAPFEGEAFQPYMTLHLLKNCPSPLGAVIVLPGGGYGARARHEAQPIAQKFNELGFHAFVVEYRVAPYCWPAPQQDAMRAIAIVRANAARWQIDPDHIAVCGFSAGGHLAGCAGTTALDVDRLAGDGYDAVPAHPDALILCYAVLTAAGGLSHKLSLQRLAGAEDPAPELLELFSLEKQIRPETPPAFLWHTAADQTVSVKNSLLFAQNMWARGKRAELHVFPEGVHGLGLASDKNDVRVWPSLAARFLEGTGFPCLKRSE